MKHDFRGNSLSNDIEKHIQLLNQLNEQTDEYSIKIPAYLKALDQIGKLGAPNDAQYLTKFTLTNHSQIAQKSAATIRLLLRKTRGTTWHSLYESFRYCWDVPQIGSISDSPRHFKKVRSQKIQQLQECYYQFPIKTATHVCGTFSCNHDGYVREKAIEQFGKYWHPEALGYLILRLNDWVPEVQSRAHALFEEVLSTIPLTEFFRISALINWLGVTSRINLKNVQESILIQIKNPQMRDECVHSIKIQNDFRARLFGWKVMMNEKNKNQMLLDVILEDPAPEIKQWAIRSIFKPEDFKKHFLTFLTDKSARVRYTALTSIPHDQSQEYLAFIRNSIFDASKKVRVFTRFFLDQYEKSSHINRYRKKMNSTNSNITVGIMAGLTETGTEDDIPQIEELFHHSHPKIRESALRGLHRLNAPNINDLCMAALQDNNAKVRNTSISILKSHRSNLRERLEGLLKTGNTKTKKSVLKLMFYSGGLESLKATLIILSSPEERLHDTAWHYLHSWRGLYGINLWFDYSNNVYKETLMLLHQLREKKTPRPPQFAAESWKELPAILELLKKQ